MSADATRIANADPPIEDVQPDVPRPLDATRLRQRLAFARAIGDQQAVGELERLIAASPLLAPAEVGS